MKKLLLEINDIEDQTGSILVPNGIVMTTPPIGENYWLFRVRLYKDQAILAFPKFSLLGVGFALEEDWNRNLPIDNRSTDSDLEEIWSWIRCNKKYPQITKKIGMEALKLIRTAYDRFGKPFSVIEKIKAGKLELPKAENMMQFVSMLREDFKEKVPTQKKR